MAKAKGVRVGLDMLHYALMTDEATETYALPKRILGAITATVSPEVNSETLYADDQADEVATSLGGITVEFNVKDIPAEVYTEILAAKADANGVLLENKTDTPPYLALGWRSKKSNGKYRYYWLFKGKFTLPEDSFQTKEDSPSFSTPTVSSTFLPRQTDGYWRAWADEDAEGMDPLVIANWFTAVYVPEIGTGSGN